MQAVQYRNTMANAKFKTKIDDDGWQTFTVEELRARRREEQRRLEEERIRKEREAEEQVARLLNHYRELTVRRGKRPAAAIIREVSVKHGIPVEEIVGVSRSKHIVAARQEAMYRVRKERPDMSLPMIGKAFGGKDHTTVLHAVRKFEAQRAALSEGAER